MLFYIHTISFKTGVDIVNVKRGLINGAMLFGLVMFIILLSPIARAAYLDQEWKSERLNNNDFDEPYGLCVHDIDNDGTYEIIVGTDHSTIEVYDGKTRDLKWEKAISQSDKIIDCIRVGNVDDDASLEIVVAFNAGPWTGGFAVLDAQSKKNQCANAY